MVNNETLAWLLSLREDPVRMRLMQLGQSYETKRGSQRDEDIENAFPRELALLRTPSTYLLDSIKKFVFQTQVGTTKRYGFRDRAEYADHIVYARKEEDAAHIHRKIIQKPYANINASNFVGIDELWIFWDDPNPEGCFASPRTDIFVPVNVLRDKLLTLEREIS